MPKIEVRCCCDAHLIGWVEMRHRPLAWSIVTMPLRADGPFEPTQPTPPERLTFEVAEIVTPPRVRSQLEIETSNYRLPPLARGGTYFALKSRDYPIEQLRRIAGFTEATPEQIAEAR